jgi:hypothetical protein
MPATVLAGMRFVRRGTINSPITPHGKFSSTISMANKSGAGIDDEETYSW